MEMVSEAKILLVYQKCDKCNDGIMKSDGTCDMSFPPIYLHKCSNCGHKVGYNIRYPYQRIIPIEKLREQVGKELED